MPKLRGYLCACGNRFEHLHMRDGEAVTCRDCGKALTDDDEVLGGTRLETIVPMHNKSLRSKAGYVHTHGDRPAEKAYISVPRGKSDV